MYCKNIVYAFVSFFKGHGTASPEGLWIELEWGMGWVGVLALVGDKAKRWGVQKCQGTMICYQQWLVTAHNQGIDNNPLQSTNNQTHFSGSDIFPLTYILSKFQHTFINILPIVSKRNLIKHDHRWLLFSSYTCCVASRSKVTTFKC